VANHKRSHEGYWIIHCPLQAESWKSEDSGTIYIHISLYDISRLIYRESSTWTENDNFRMMNSRDRRMLARPAVCADVPELVVEGEGAELLVLTQEAQQHAYTTPHTDVGDKA
jgi:hypothetical protein